MKRDIVVGLVELSRSDADFSQHVAMHAAYLNRIPGYRAVPFNSVFDAAWSLATQEGVKWIVVFAQDPIGAPVEAYKPELREGVHTLVLTLCNDHREPQDPTIVTEIDQAVLASRRTMTCCARAHMGSEELRQILNLKAA